MLAPLASCATVARLSSVATFWRQLTFQLQGAVYSSSATITLRNHAAKESNETGCRNSFEEPEGTEAVKAKTSRYRTVHSGLVFGTVSRNRRNDSFCPSVTTSGHCVPDDLLVKPDLRRSPTSGVLLVFGQGDVGQLGLGEEVVEKVRPAVIPGYQDVVAVAAGGMHNVCLRETGEVLTFGCNDEGALGRDTSAEGSETKPGRVKLPGKVVQVTAGDSHSAALLEDGRAFAWGSFRDSHGTMGLTLKGNEQFPIEILPNVKIVKIASGADHLVLLNENGHVYTCGCGEQGQLGRVAARAASRNTRHGMGPLLSPGLVEFKITRKLEFGDIWAGTYCTFAKEYHSGDIYVFGLNNYHQMGLKEPRTHFHPQISKTFSGKIWKHISSGQHHTIALDDSGHVFVMGRKEYGRLGLGSNCSDAKELTAVPALSSFKCVDVAAGSAQSFAVTESGDLYSWGMGTSGQLGTGDEEDVEEPVLVKGKQLEGKTVIRVAGGGQHTLALATIHPAKEETAG